MDYVLLKQVHIALALISLGGFILRWFWRMKNSQPGTSRLVRAIPHIIDTLFLASGVMLAMNLDQFPFKNEWLTAKVVGLICYILFGIAAMSNRNSTTGRIFAFLLALLIFSWIISVAHFKTAWGFFGA